MSTALLREVLADKEAFVSAEKEAGLIAAKVFSNTFGDSHAVRRDTEKLVPIKSDPTPTPVVKPVK